VDLLQHRLRIAGVMENMRDVNQVEGAVRERQAFAYADSDRAEASSFA
jgi:hypothetical protein